MPTTRRALLISNPGEAGAKNYCKGVYVDLQNYQRFLTSPEGGGWFSSEIEPMMDRPTKSALRSKVSEMAHYDFTLIMFTGHGWYSSTDNDRVLILRSGEEIPSLELCQNANKRIVVLDCCQIVHQESLMEKRAHMVCFANEAGIPRQANMENCRKLYTKEIDAAPRSCIRTFSCGINEESTDNDETGGLYNSSLLNSAERWAISQANNLWVQEDSLSIVQSHEMAAERTRKESGGTQNPSITKPKSEPYFPFAVFA
jgi:hypothetical protein